MCGGLTAINTWKYLKNGMKISDDWPVSMNVIGWVWIQGSQFACLFWYLFTKWGKPLQESYYDNQKFNEDCNHSLLE